MFGIISFDILADVTDLDIMLPVRQIINIRQPANTIYYSFLSQIVGSSQHVSTVRVVITSLCHLQGEYGCYSNGSACGRLRSQPFT
jgi:hypothetical protein